MFTMRRARWLALAMTVSSLFGVGYGGGCYNLGTQGAVDALVPCGIWDCSGPILGGAISLCGQPGNPNDDIVAGCP
jgi:hypothetical protein